MENFYDFIINSDMIQTLIECWNTIYEYVTIFLQN